MSDTDVIQKCARDPETYQARHVRWPRYNIFIGSFGVCLRFSIQMSVSVYKHALCLCVSVLGYLRAHGVDLFREKFRVMFECTQCSFMILTVSEFCDNCMIPGTNYPHYTSNTWHWHMRHIYNNFWWMCEVELENRLAKSHMGENYVLRLLRAKEMCVYSFCFDFFFLFAITIMKKDTNR